MVATGPAPSSTSSELVLGLPRDTVPGGLDWRGIRAEGTRGLLDAVSRLGEFRVRSEIEDDPSFQQVIPYVILTDGPHVFLMRRLRAGGDTRLHDRYSIGVGGHVGVGDGGMAGGLAREWSEELVADWTPDFVPVGLLNDDTDPVGAVHLGVVYRVEAAGRAVAVRETHKLEGTFAPVAEVDALGDRLETWSRLCLEQLLGIGHGMSPTDLQSLRDLLGDPNVAFILFTLGLLGLLTELHSPNLVTGLLGAVALVLALVGFSTLPLNTMGLLLIILAVVLFALEVAVTSHGLLALGGLVAFVLGASMLYTRSDPPSATDVSVALPVIGVMTTIAAAFLGLVVLAAVRNRRMPPANVGVHSEVVPRDLIGMDSEVRNSLLPTGTVYAAGEEWTARSSDGRDLDRGTPVRIVGQDGLVLIVDPLPR